jgi:hypothetical protein
MSKVHDSSGSYEALVEERSTLAFATKPVVGRKPQSRQPMVLRVLLGQGSLLGGSRCTSSLPEKWKSTSNLRVIWSIYILIV